MKTVLDTISVDLKYNISRRHRHISQTYNRNFLFESNTPKGEYQVNNRSRIQLRWSHDYNAGSRIHTPCSAEAQPTNAREIYRGRSGQLTCICIASLDITRLSRQPSFRRQAYPSTNAYPTNSHEQSGVRFKMCSYTYSWYYCNHDYYIWYALPFLPSTSPYPRSLKPLLTPTQGQQHRSLLLAPPIRLLLRRLVHRHVFQDEDRMRRLLELLLH